MFFVLIVFGSFYDCDCVFLFIVFCCCVVRCGWGFVGCFDFVVVVCGGGGYWLVFFFGYGGGVVFGVVLYDFGVGCVGVVVVDFVGGLGFFLDL